MRPSGAIRTLFLLTFFSAAPFKIQQNGDLRAPDKLSQFGEDVFRWSRVVRTRGRMHLSDLFPVPERLRRVESTDHRGSEQPL